ncbi:hypothetical protein FKM82_028784 [Ascaphus truei]
MLRPKNGSFLRMSQCFVKMFLIFPASLLYPVRNAKSNFLLIVMSLCLGFNKSLLTSFSALSIATSIHFFL